MCSTDDTHLKLECFLSGEREKATVAGSVRFLFGERVEASMPALFVMNNLRPKNLYGNSSAKSI